MMLSNVDFPHPEGPISATNSPFCKDRSTPFRTSSLFEPDPNPLFRPETSSIGQTKARVLMMFRLFRFEFPKHEDGNLVGYS